MATRYYQCSKCKKLLSFSDTLKSSAQITELIKCHSRRMRELTKNQYDHEVLQRDYIENGGPEPSGTAEMERLNV